jgi:hypothetical protein
MSISLKRKHSGASTVRSNCGSIGLVLICLALLIGVAIGIIQLCLIFGGSQSVRNAVDAGALNVATHAVDLKTVPAQTYKDCADTSGSIGLANVNRVIGKALLICANAAQAQASGQAGSCSGSASSAYAEAQAITQGLTSQLMNSGIMEKYFNQLAHSNDEKEANLLVAFVHRGETSNIGFKKKQIPQGTKIPGAEFIPGYTPITAGGQVFCFVTFRQGEMPHLIATEEFAKNTQQASPLPAKGVVPNAFHVSGKITQQDVVMEANACAVANPLLNYDLSIPHAYVQIKINPTPVNWTVNNKTAGVTKYEFSPKEDWGVHSYLLSPKSTMNGYASLGNEYGSKSGQVSLLDVIMAVPGDHEPALEAVVQRLSEIDSGFSEKTLVKLLKSQNVQPQVYDYVLYPQYSTPDNTRPKIVISTQDNVKAPWYQFEDPEGTAETIATDQLTNAPNRNWEQIIGEFKDLTRKVEVKGKLLWSPGTGYHQNLGVLNIQRMATVSWKG